MICTLNLIWEVIGSHHGKWARDVICYCWHSLVRWQAAVFWTNWSFSVAFVDNPRESLLQRSVLERIKVWMTTMKTTWKEGPKCSLPAIPKESYFWSMMESKSLETLWILMIVIVDHFDDVRKMPSICEVVINFPMYKKTPVTAEQLTSLLSTLSFVTCLSTLVHIRKACQGLHYI